MSIFDRIKEGLTKTRENLTSRLFGAFLKHKYISEELYEDLEEILISADISAELVFEVLEELREKAIQDRIKDVMELYQILQDMMSATIPDTSPLALNEEGISVILVVGVNGVGKTTTIGKLASILKRQNKKVMLVAADTFRAAAAEQLSIWADRTGSAIIKHEPGGDPAAVIFDAIHAARARQYDVLLIDTAGRLHNKKNLMNELAKIGRVLQREVPDAPHETLLIIDATTGQNGVLQASAFNDATNLSGLILTKMDGTAKGGVIFNIAKTYNLPVKFIGIGEKVEDLLPFDKEAFIQALFKREE